VKGASTPA